MMKLAEAEQLIKKELESVYEEGETAAIALLLLEHYTGLRRDKLSFERSSSLSADQETLLKRHLMQLQQQEPIQYILNEAHFYGLDLYVDKNVLIPRPETEELVDWIIKDVKASGAMVFKKEATDADATAELKILDIGTGSGCIALALKNAMSKAEVWGCDISEEALNIARRNSAHLDIRVDFQGIDFLDEAQQKLLPTVNSIVSNPPYIPLKEKSEMKGNVVNHEPHTALFVPNEDALLFYKAISGFARKRLYDGGAIYVEIHEGLGEAVVNLFKNEGYQEVELKKDMQGKDRMVKALKKRIAEIDE